MLPGRKRRGPPPPVHPIPQTDGSTEEPEEIRRPKRRSRTDLRATAPKYAVTTKGKEWYQGLQKLHACKAACCICPICLDHEYAASQQVLVIINGYGNEGTTVDDVRMVFTESVHTLTDMIEEPDGCSHPKKFENTRKSHTLAKERTYRIVRHLESEGFLLIVNPDQGPSVEEQAISDKIDLLTQLRDCTVM